MSLAPIRLLTSIFRTEKEITLWNALGQLIRVDCSRKPAVHLRAHWKEHSGGVRVKISRKSLPMFWLSWTVVRKALEIR